jgi:large subunit ribosomal protein L4
MKGKDLKADILNIKGEKVGTIDLDPEVFDGQVNKDLLYQVITAYLANQRKGTASTKTRGEVRGGGRKPWRQKYTGRARAGSIRSPIWRGGGVVFGPKPRDYSIDLPKRMKRLALKSSLNAKWIDDELLFLDKLEMDEPKTKKFVEVLKNLGLEGVKSLFILDEVSKNTRLSARNIPYVFLEHAKQVTAYDILNYKKVILTKEGLDIILERIKKK